MSIISVDNLNKSFNYYEKQDGIKNSFKNLFAREKLTKQAVQNISFQIDRGEIVGFLGPNGAGKTTTLKMLSGILYPTSGVASVMGYTPWKREKDFKMKFSMVMGQKSQLWIDLPAIETFKLNKSIYEVEDKAYNSMIEELSEYLDVKHILNVQVRRLSLGERMKLELIASLIHSPEIIFLDEPSIGLDLTSQRKIRSFISYLNQQNKITVMITSHYMKDIEDLCERVIVINGGAKIYDGGLQDVNKMFQDIKTVKLEFSKDTDVIDWGKYGTVVKRDCAGCTMEVNKNMLHDLINYAVNELKVRDINIEDIPIEKGIELLYR